MSERKGDRGSREIERKIGEGERERERDRCGRERERERERKKIKRETGAVKREREIRRE